MELLIKMSPFGNTESSIIFVKRYISCQKKTKSTGKSEGRFFQIVNFLDQFDYHSENIIGPLRGSGKIFMCQWGSVSMMIALCLLKRRLK